jgi:hypothetical protein
VSSQQKKIAGFPVDYRSSRHPDFIDCVSRTRRSHSKSGKRIGKKTKAASFNAIVGYVFLGGS